MQWIAKTSVHTEQADLSSFPAFHKARRRAFVSCTLLDALSSSHIRFPLSNSCSKEQRCCIALWSLAICCLMDSLVSSFIMSHCTWDSNTGNALPA